MAEKARPGAKPVRPRKTASPRARVSAPREQPATPHLAPSGPVSLTSAEIAERAYYLYLERGATSGKELEDWLQAERELEGVSR